MIYEIVILAAGKGTRMKSDLPKALMPLSDSTLIEILLSRIHKNPAPIIVVGHQADRVKRQLGQGYKYANQINQLGTGHAVMQAANLVNDRTDSVLILYGDQPLIDQQVINELFISHKRNVGPLTIGVIKVPDFDDWRHAFVNYGRIVRNEEGEVIKIVEYKDASPKEKLITEVNPAYFVADKKWLFNNLEKLKNDNAQGEYYLTDLVQIAFEERGHINAVNINPISGLGANTRDQLQVIEGMINN